MSSIVRRVARRPADAATGMQHVSVVSVSASAPVLSAPLVPVFLPALVVVVVITPTLVVVCPVLEGDSAAVVLHLSAMRLVNLILRVNGQDGNVNTMCIASRRRLLGDLWAAAAVLCLDSVDMRASTVF